MADKFSDAQVGLTSPITRAREYATTAFATDLELDQPARLFTIYGKNSGASYVEFTLIGDSTVLREDIVAKQRLDLPYRVNRIKAGSTVAKVRVSW